MGVTNMAVVKASSKDINLLARLLRAEAEGEGVQGMLMVGNVGINRIRANCSDFVGLRTIPQMIHQPHAFEAVTHGYFYQRARESERRLARRAINGERLWRQSSVCGISDRQGRVPHSGIISRMSAALKRIVFMSRQRKSVRMSIIRFNKNIPFQRILKRDVFLVKITLQVFRKTASYLQTGKRSSKP